MTPSPEAVCARISAEMHDFYMRNRVALGNRGYRVMYGPPVMNPPILFIGFQPGGAGPGDDDLSDGRSPLWPAKCDYAIKQWRLAKAMQGMFGESLLSRCTGLNSIFVRSPDVKTYRSEVPLALRRTVEDFCRPRVAQIIAAVQPAMIVTIGLESLRLFGATAPVLVNAMGRSLIEQGSVGATAAFGALHLSGARIAAADRSAMTDWLLGKLALAGEPR